MDISQINPFIRYIDITLFNRYYTQNTISYDSRLFFVLKGNSIITMNDEKYKISENSLILFPQGIRYKFETEIDHFIELLIVNFDFTQTYSDITEPLTPDFESDFDAQKITEKSQFKPFYSPICLDDMWFIKEDLLKIHQEACLKKPYYQDNMAALFKGVLISVARCLSKQSANIPPMIQTLINYISVNYGSEISNETLGNVAKYHPYYLNRLMRKYTGKSLQEYIRAYRLSIAAKLIATSVLPFEEIAMLTGFKNQSHFSKCFKKYIGKTPGEYRHTNYQQLI